MLWFEQTHSGSITRGKRSHERRGTINMHFLSVRGMVSRGLLIVKDSIHITTFLFLRQTLS
jgi:hypothetical protein